MPPPIDWHHLWTVIAFALGFVVRRPPEIKRAPEQEEQELEALVHKTYAGLPPWGFWLTLATLVIGVAVNFVRLTFEVEDLRRWKQSTQASHFTDRDWERERLAIQKEIELERTFTRSLCNELSRLSRELGKIPANDCSRP